MFAHLRLTHKAGRAVGASTNAGGNRLAPSPWRFIAIAACALVAAISDPRPTVAAAENAHAHRLDTTADPTEWIENGRTAAGQFFSPITQIDIANALRLGLAWQLRTRTYREMEATSLF